MPRDQCRRSSVAERNPRIRVVVLNAYWFYLDRDPIYWRSEQRVVDQLRTAGKTVVVIAGVPDPGVDVPWASGIRERWGRPPLRLSCPKAAIPLSRVVLVDVSDAFCGKPVSSLYSDNSHPSRYAGLAIIACGPGGASNRPLSFSFALVAGCRTGSYRPAA